MKTQKVSFGKRYLPEPTTKKLQNVLTKMNSQTEYKSTKMSFESNILTCLQTALGSITDCRLLAKPKRSIADGRARIKINKIIMELDIKTGEVLPISKISFFTRWKTAYKKVENFLDTLQSNFENKNVVEKHYSKITGLTKRGEDKFRRAAKVASETIED